MGAYGGHGHIKSKKNKQDWVLTEAMAISSPRKQKIGVGAYGGHGQIKSKKQNRLECLRRPWPYQIQEQKIAHGGKVPFSKQEQILNLVCSRGNVHVRIEKHKHTQATTHDKTSVLDMWHNVHGGIGHSHSKKK